MNDLEILSPPDVQITLAGRICAVKPLSIKEAIELGRTLSALPLQAGGKNTLNEIFAQAPTEVLRKVLHILTHNQLKDIENLEDKISLKDFSHLAKTAGEVNDFSLILLNFKTALRGKSK